MKQKTIKNNGLKIIFARSSFLIISLFLFANKALADWAMPSTPPTGVATDIDAALLSLTNYILGFITMISVLAIIWGGVTYIGSVGDENKASTGKKIITYALIGLFVAGIAYAIVNVIVSDIL